MTMRHRQLLFPLVALVHAHFAVEHADVVVASAARSDIVLRVWCDDGANTQASPNDTADLDALAAFLRDHGASARLECGVEVRSSPTAADWSWLATATSLEGFPDRVEHAHVDSPNESLLHALKQATGERPIATLALAGGELRESLGPAIDRLDVEALVLQNADLSNAATALVGHAATSVEAWNCTDVSADAFAALLRCSQLERLAFFECATPDARELAGEPRIDLSGAPNLKFLDVAGLRGLRITAREIDILRTRPWQGLGLWLASEPLDVGREPARIAALGDQPHLHTLRILSGELDAADVEWLGGRPNLERLELFSTTVADALEASNDVPRFTRLSVLELNGVDNTPTVLDALGRMPSLRQLTLSDCDAVDDTTVATLAAFPHTFMERIDLSGTRVTSACLEVLAAWPNLRFVDLQWTRVEEGALLRFAKAHPELEFVGIRREPRDE